MNILKKSIFIFLSFSGLVHAQGKGDWLRTFPETLYDCHVAELGKYLHDGMLQVNLECREEDALKKPSYGDNPRAIRILWVKGQTTAPPFIVQSGYLTLNGKNLLPPNGVTPYLNSSLGKCTMTTDSTRGIYSNPNQPYSSKDVTCRK
jgi:hypothetical protein